MTPERNRAVDGHLLSMTRRVTMGDVDAAGILYLAVPYQWQEALWTGLLYETGRPLSSLLAEGVGGAIVASSAHYSAPATMDTILTCRLYAEDIGRRSFGLRMEAAFPNESIAVTVRTRHVWCKLSPGALEPAPVPDWLREVLAGEAAALTPSSPS